MKKVFRLLILAGAVCMLGACKKGMEDETQNNRVQDEVQIEMENMSEVSFFMGKEGEAQVILPLLLSKKCENITGFEFADCDAEIDNGEFFFEKEYMGHYLYYLVLNIKRDQKAFTADTLKLCIDGQWQNYHPGHVVGKATDYSWDLGTPQEIFSFRRVTAGTFEAEYTSDQTEIKCERDGTLLDVFLSSDYLVPDYQLIEKKFRKYQKGDTVLLEWKFSNEVVKYISYEIMMKSSAGENGEVIFTKTVPMTSNNCIKVMEYYCNTEVKK